MSAVDGIARRVTPGLARASPARVPDPAAIGDAALAYRADVDGLRAVAILAVVAYHADVAVLGGGFVGVDVFLVLSGYLVGAILWRELSAGTFSARGFAVRRARRLVPALAATIAGTLAAGLVLAPPDALEALARSALAAAAFVSNVTFWQAEAGGYFGEAATHWPLLHTWSLAVEAQAYLVLAVLLWLLRGRSIRLAALAVAVLLAGSFALAAVAAERTPSAAFFLLPTRWWEIALGALVALVAVPMPRLVRETAAAAGLAAIVAAILLFDAGTAVPGAPALLPCLGTAAVLAAGRAGPTATNRLLAAPALVVVGLLSYSLYLWHWPVLAFLRAERGVDVLAPADAAAGVALAVVLAVLSFRLVERPCRRRGGPRLVPAAALLAAVLVAGAAVATSGLPQRFSPAVQRIHDTAFDAVTQDCADRPVTDPCTSDPGRPADLLLWGDSHARAAIPGVWQAARRTGHVAAAVTRPACPPLLGVAPRSPAYAGCADFNAAVLALLEARPEVRTVVLAARWPAWSEGTLMPGERGEATWLEAVPSGPAGDRPDAGAPSAAARHGVAPERPPGRGGGGAHARTLVEANRRLLRAGLARTVETIRATGRTVVLLGPVPEPGFDVPFRLARHLTFGVALPPSPPPAVAGRTGPAEAALAALAGPGVVHLALADRLCRPVCQVADGALPYYADDDHLAPDGALTVIAPPLERTLRSLPDRAR